MSDPRVPFTFEGRELFGKETDTAASALWAAGVRIGLWCGSGYCMQCRLCINGDPNVRACLVPLRSGMSIRRGGLPHES